MGLFSFDKINFYKGTKHKKGKKMTKTFRELIEIDGIVARLYQTDPELKKTKFFYAYQKYYAKSYAPVQEELQTAIQMARINNALEDEKTKEILLDQSNPRGYKFSKDGLRKCIEEEQKIVKEFENREVEIVPYISSLVPEGLTDEEKELLTGVVI